MLNAADFQNLPRVPTVMTQLELYATKLLHDFDWCCLDNRYRDVKQLGDGIFPRVTNRYGRIGIEFLTEGYTPGISVGFLYDPSDHGVELTMPNKGIDLMLRIEADPAPNNDCGTIIDRLKEGRKRISEKEKQEGWQIHTQVRLRDEPGNKNRWSLLIAQKCLADVVANCHSETEQLKAIHNYFRHLIEELFSNPKLEDSFRRLQPFTGAMKLSEGTNNWGAKAPNSPYRC